MCFFVELPIDLETILWYNKTIKGQEVKKHGNYQ